MLLMTEIELARVNHFVLRKQHLTLESQVDDVVQVAGDISGLHATGIKEPYLALFARMRNFTMEKLDEALRVKRSLGKIRCMRGTLYILPADMLPVAYAATCGMVQYLSRRYSEFRGISDNEYAIISKKVMALLKGREMSVAEIKKELGIKTNLAAALNFMCDEGLLARVQTSNSWSTRNYKYAIFREYSDIDLDEFSEDEALIKLVESYLKSFGPATETDIAWWTGLTKTKIRVALERLSSKIAYVAISGLDGDFLILRSELEALRKTRLGGEPVVNLLPNLDPYLMGYKQRDRYVSSEYFTKVFDRSGNVTSIILVDGRIAGVWDYSELEMKIFLFKKLLDSVKQQVELKAQAMGEFITGAEVRVREVGSMVPLSERTVGGFMSPLKGMT